MPVLEAQLLGTPAITTVRRRPAPRAPAPCWGGASLLGGPRVRSGPVSGQAFGAMRDFTQYGVSVPPLQPHYMGLGYAVMPSAAGSGRTPD
jgi:hypothetical protein